MGMSARETLERDAATWPLWQRLLVLGLRWPVRTIFFVSGVIVSLRTVLHIPINDVVVFAAMVVLIAITIWMSLAGAVEMLRMSFEMPGIAPAWIKRVISTWSFLARWGGAMAMFPVGFLLMILIFPSLRNEAVIYVALALICLGLAPMLLLIAVLVLALPIVIPIGIVRSIRNRRDRRYREIYRYLGHPPW